MVRRKKYTTGKQHPFTFQIDASTHDKLTALAKLNHISAEEEVYRSLRFRMDMRERIAQSHQHIWGKHHSNPHSDEVYGRLLTTINNTVRIEKENHELREENARLKKENDLFNNQGV